MSMNGLFNYEKLVIKEGYGKLLPNEFSECHIILHLREPEMQVSSNTLSSIQYQLDREIKIVVGHGVTEIACMIDLCILTMFEGECCRLQFKHSAAQSAATDAEMFAIEVTLLSFIAASDLCSISQEDCLKQAITLKDLGTSAFVAGHVSAAFHKFSRSLKYLICASVANDQSFSSCTGDCATCAGDDSSPVMLANGDASESHVCNLTREDVTRLTCRCWLNLAACQMRYQNFRMALINCSKALAIEPNNVKGLFRRAQCNVKTGNEHAAVIDLERAVALEPRNQEITKLLNTARQLVRKSDDKLAAAMSKMFH